jgi:Ca2+-binding RTX toxin-like protein
VENIKLEESADYINAYGNGVANTLLGNSNDNVLVGFNGNDTLLGGGGRDGLIGGAGDDILNGGDGVDSVNYGDIYYQAVYSDSELWGVTGTSGRSGVIVDLVSGIATGAGNDTLLNIETVVGSRFNDIITGDKNTNYLGGGLGDDTLKGGEGSDVLILGQASAAGLTVDMSTFSLTGVNTINLSTLSQNVPNQLGRLTYSEFEGVGLSELADVYFGSAKDDTALGLGGSDLMYGNDGNDVIFGMTPAQTQSSLRDIVQADTLFGGNGNDSLYGSWGNDTLSGDAGDDQLSSFAGNDTLYGGDGNDGVYGGDGNDSVYGGLGNDTLDGGNGSDFLNGGAGNDVVNGGTGDDVLFGGGGTDILAGGRGDDYYIYTGAEKINEDASSGTDTVIITNGVTAAYTLADNVENAALVEGDSTSVGWFSATPVLTGNASDNLLMGNSIANTILGGAGNDTLFGFGGDDTLTGGAGNDLFGLNTDMYGRRDASGLTEYGGTIADFGTGADKLLLNFASGTGSGIMYHYQLNNGTSTSFLNDTPSTAPEARIDYDPMSGILNLSFQQHQDNGAWVYNDSPNLTYQLGATTFPTTLDVNSFLINTDINPLHPVAADNSYLNQTLLHPH